MISLGGDLIGAMNGETLTVTRVAGGAYNDDTGLWEGGATETLEVLASVQALNGDDIVRVPEADRVKKVLKLYSDTELRVHDERTGAKADEIDIEGEPYQVRIVEKWPSFWKAIVVRIETATLPG